MDQEIIDKLNLQETDIQFGQTLKHGVKIYKYNDNFFITEADVLGEPSEIGHLLCFTKDFKKHGKVSQKLLLELPADEIKKNFDYYSNLITL